MNRSALPAGREDQEAADGQRQRLSFRIDEDAIPWSAEEHRARADAVRALESVDGAKAFAGRGPSEDRLKAENALETYS